MQLHHEAMSKAVLEILSQVLERSGQALPQGIDTELPQPPTMTIPWSKFWLSIDVANLPLQAAIDLVSYLVLLQSGRSRFSEGVATVGGRIHIGIVRKNLKFEMLNEPGLEHKYTGFGENA